MKTPAPGDLGNPQKKVKTTHAGPPPPTYVLPPPTTTHHPPPPTTSGNPFGTVPIFSLHPPTTTPFTPFGGFGGPGGFGGFGGLGGFGGFAPPAPFHFGLPPQPPTQSVVQQWQPPKQAVLQQIQQNLTSPPPPPVDLDLAAYNRKYSDTDVVQRFGYPSATSEQRQRQLAQDLDDHIRKIDAEVTHEERPKHLPKPLQQRVRAELGSLAPLNLANNSLGEAWDEALENYGGSMRGIPLYKAIRSSKGVRESIDDLGIKAKSTKVPEYHHLLKKQRHPDLATKARNLSVLSRGDRTQSGQHDLLHRLFAGGQGNIYVEAVPAVEREADDLLKLGAYKDIPGKQQSQRVLKHLS